MISLILVTKFKVSFVFHNLKEYKLAQFHCYGRYLTKHVQRSLTLAEAAELDTDTFYKIHLPNGFDDMASATMVVGVQPSVFKWLLAAFIPGGNPMMD